MRIEPECKDWVHVVQAMRDTERSAGGWKKAFCVVLYLVEPWRVPRLLLFAGVQRIGLRPGKSEGQYPRDKIEW